MRVTHTQNNYLCYLDTGAKTTREVAAHLDITVAVAGKMLHKLVNKGLVKSTNNRGAYGYLYRLAAPYEDLINSGLIVKDYHRNKGTAPKGNRITQEELEYVARLRKEGLTGRELNDRYHEEYPDRSTAGIANIVLKARRAKLCR